ncbi:TPA: GNAT family N-acetyltransferase, partial [Legionella pneumophila subsp. pneumophila]|nr:GNAT family N-acetyltransferase [Legionella pneumophila subsp. pneumophila]
MAFRIRNFIVGDEVEIYKLFHDAVHSINSKDYDEVQLNTWAPKEADLEKWRESLERNYTLVAVEEQTNVIVGFADLEKNGHIDRGYVNKDYQARGVGLALLKALEQKAIELGMKELYADVSITAKKFLEFKGYVTEKEQTVSINGVKFINYLMRK